MTVGAVTLEGFSAVAHVSTAMTGAMRNLRFWGFQAREFFDIVV